MASRRSAGSSHTREGRTIDGRNHPNVTGPETVSERPADTQVFERHRRIGERPRGEAMAAQARQSRRRARDVKPGSLLRAIHNQYWRCQTNDAGEAQRRRSRPTSKWKSNRQAAPGATSTARLRAEVAQSQQDLPEQEARTTRGEWVSAATAPIPISTAICADQATKLFRSSSRKPPAFISVSRGLDRAADLFKIAFG